MKEIIEYLGDNNDVEDIIKKGSKISDFIFVPIFSLLPSIIKNKLSLFNAYHIFLSCISRFSFGLFIGCSFPDFFRKHRGKIFLIGVLSALPLINKVLFDKE